MSWLRALALAAPIAATLLMLVLAAAPALGILEQPWWAESAQAVMVAAIMVAAICGLLTTRYRWGPRSVRDLFRSGWYHYTVAPTWFGIGLVGFLLLLASIFAGNLYLAYAGVGLIMLPVTQMRLRDDADGN